jgi:hypothetical protein
MLANNHSCYSAPWPKLTFRDISHDLINAGLSVLSKSEVNDRVAHVLCVEGLNSKLGSEVSKLGLMGQLHP